MKTMIEGTSEKRRKSSFLKVVTNISSVLILSLLMSCDNKMESISTETCAYDNFLGEYLFYSKTDTSTLKIEIDFFEENFFQTTGIGGYGFWFPSAPLTGQINDCQIILDAYQDVEREGLNSPGGIPRYYYESMSGFGEYFSENDSIKLFITFERTGDFEEYFSGEVYLVKDD